MQRRLPLHRDRLRLPKIPHRRKNHRCIACRRNRCACGASTNRHDRYSRLADRLVRLIIQNLFHTSLRIQKRCASSNSRTPPFLFPGNSPLNSPFCKSKQNKNPRNAVSQALPRVFCWKGSTKKMPLGYSLSYQYLNDFETSQDFTLPTALSG